MKDNTDLWNELERIIASINNLPEPMEDLTKRDNTDLFNKLEDLKDSLGNISGVVTRSDVSEGIVFDAQDIIYITEGAQSTNIGVTAYNSSSSIMIAHKGGGDFVLDLGDNDIQIQGADYKTRVGNIYTFDGTQQSSIFLFANEGRIYRFSNQYTPSGSTPPPYEILKSLAFNGTDEYVNVPHNPVFNFPVTSARSWVFWFYPTTFSGIRVIMAKQSGITNIGWTIQTQSTTGKLRANMRSNPNVLMVEHNTAPILNAWNKGAVVYNNRVYTLYLNGVADTNIISSSLVGGDDINNIYPVRIGANDNPQSFFQGNVSFCAELNIALTSLQVATASELTDPTTWKDATNPIPLANIVEYWKNDTFNPIGLNGNDGTGINMDISNESSNVPT